MLLFVLVEKDDTMLNATYLGSPAPAVLQRPWWPCSLPLVFAFDGVWLTRTVRSPLPQTLDMQSAAHREGSFL